jgi:hypothetical protein
MNSRRVGIILGYNLAQIHETTRKVAKNGLKRWISHISIIPS